MANDTKYEGWTNRETWCVALAIYNDERTLSEYRRQAAESYRNAVASDDGRASRRSIVLWELAEVIKGDHEEANPTQGQPSVFADLMDCALGNVEWGEIAGQLIDDVAEEVDARMDAEETAEAEGGE